MSETFEELENQIVKMFKEADEAEDISLIHDCIWPAVVKWENFFRKTGDIRALEQQVGLLFEMSDNIFRGGFLSDAYVICRRILDIDPNKEEAKHTIKHHIIPYFKRDLSHWEENSKKDKEAEKILEHYKKTNESIESELDSYFIKCKNDKFELFLDDNANQYNGQGDDRGER